MINEEFVDNNKKSLFDRIKQIKSENPGKFDHLPDPKPGSSFENWSKNELDEMLKKFKEKEKNLDEHSKNTKDI